MAAEQRCPHCQRKGAAYLSMHAKACPMRKGAKTISKAGHAKPPKKVDDVDVRIVRRGRPRAEVDLTKVERLRGTGQSLTKVARALGVHRNTVGRAYKDSGTSDLVTAIRDKKAQIARLQAELAEIAGALADEPLPSSTKARLRD